MQNSVRNKVQNIIWKHYTEYTVADINDLSKLKLQIWWMVNKAEWEYLEAEQIYKRERTAEYLNLKSLWAKTDKLAVESAYLETNDLKIDSITKEMKFKELRSYHNDLQDVLIAVRMSARLYDKDLSNNNA